jgi:hypothetical protein
LVAVTPAHTGSESRRCSAQSERGRRHETYDDAGRSRPSRGLPGLIENLSNAAIGFSGLKSRSGGDQSYQMCSVFVSELTARACHEDTTCFRAQLGIRRIGAAI